MKKILINTFLIICLIQTAQAALRVEITKGAEGAMPIAVIPFEQIAQNSQAIPSVSGIVVADLLRSGQFSPIESDKLIARPRNLEEVNYKLWRVAGIDHLVIGSFKVIKENQYEISFRLLDVFKGTQVLGYQFSATDSSLRSVSHHISDLIYENITGQKGAFDTKIAYVTSERKQGVQPSYSLQVADTDGYNSISVLKSKQPIMSPSWSPMVDS